MLVGAPVLVRHPHRVPHPKIMPRCLSSPPLLGLPFPSLVSAAAPVALPDPPARPHRAKPSASRPPNGLTFSARTDAPPDLVVDASLSAPADVDPVATPGCTEPARCCGRDHLDLD